MSQPSPLDSLTVYDQPISTVESEDYYNLSRTTLIQDRSNNQAGIVIRNGKGRCVFHAKPLEDDPRQQRLKHGRY